MPLLTPSPADTQQLSLFCDDDTPPPKRERRIHPSVPYSPSTTDPVRLITDADWVLLNSSGGKDSQAMKSYVVSLAAAAGALHKVVVVHADLADIEWEGTASLAREQSFMLNVPRFEVVQAQGDLLARVAARYAKLKAKALAEGKPVAPAWPSASARWCTSDLKRGPIRRLMTRLTDERRHLRRPVRILNCLGQRAAESPHRQKLAPVEIDRPASNGKRHITTWRPIHHWSDRAVWAEIARSGLPYHEAYDWGMSRLSCSFCVLGCESDLVIAARRRPDKAAEYAAMETAVERDFKAKLSMREIIARAAALEAESPLVRPPHGTAMSRFVGKAVTRDYLARRGLATAA
ncbi:phosphoadenosine phosphosulfate reductase family protein [Streptomyces sp. NRRL S-146]|uniref:phosphoadenosine phosphosulfate reductase domain-containing protein n=1 Tax=Streptomyces sp. NRRL S-146 TaxID=1463884 RepID=UPI00068E70CD|nr:phosphoadenosine phosphosulfate reductase family protein [Streptomyces sp. NRRL S-146]